MTAAAITALVVLVLDQLTKAWALQALVPGRPAPVIDGFFSLTLVMNPGLAFGMLSNTPVGWRWVVAVARLASGALSPAWHWSDRSVEIRCSTRWRGSSLRAGRRSAIRSA